MNEFAISDVLPGKLNALVKNIMKQMGITDPNEAVRRINAGEWIVKLANLLKQVATVMVSACEKFVAANSFGPNNPAGIEFYLSDNFKKHFLNKVEENVLACELAVHRLERTSLDAPILNKLGSRAETLLVHLYELLSKQPHGEDGVLLTNGDAIISYIKDADGIVWAVYARWSAHYGNWRVYASPVTDPYGWDAGRQVLSQVA